MHVKIQLPQIEETLHHLRIDEPRWIAILLRRLQISATGDRLSEDKEQNIAFTVNHTNPPRPVHGPQLNLIVYMQ